MTTDSLKRLLLLVVALACAAAARAETTFVSFQETSLDAGDEDESAEEKGPVRHALDVRVSLSAEYDDNVLRLTAENARSVEDGTATPGKYRIDSVDDFLLRPEVELRWTRTPPSRRSTRLRGVLSRYYYLENSLLSYDRYRVIFEQDITDQRPDLEDLEIEKDQLDQRHFRARRAFLLANRTRLRAYYDRTPDRYRGEQRDDDTGLFVAKNLDREVWGVEWEQRLNRHPEHRYRLDGWIARDSVDYPVELQERDLRGDIYGLELNSYHLEGPYYWLLSLAHEWGDYDARKDPTGKIVDDVSTERRTWKARLAYYWYRERQDGDVLRKANMARLTLQHRIRRYTSDDPLDTSHFGKRSEFWGLTAEYLHPFLNDLTLRVYATVGDQDSTIPSSGSFDDLEESNYDNFRLGVQLSWYAGWRD